MSEIIEHLLDQARAYHDAHPSASSSASADVIKLNLSEAESVDYWVEGKFFGSPSEVAEKINRISKGSTVSILPVSFYDETHIFNIYKVNVSYPQSTLVKADDRFNGNSTAIVCEINYTSGGTSYVLKIAVTYDGTKTPLKVYYQSYQKT